MPKQRVTEFRFDFRGGLNTVATEENTAENELLVAANVRHQTTGGIGGIGPRTGSRRMHASALGGGNPITGLYVWDAPTAGKQIVAVCNGRIYYRHHSSGEWAAFTEVVPSPLMSATVPQSFAEFRGDGSGAALDLYIGDGTVVYRWDGTAATRVDGVTDFPTASLLESYAARLFANSSSYIKHLYYSAIMNGLDFTPGLGSLGGAQMIGPLSGDQITALKTVGSSLLIAGPNSVAVFRGYSAEDIQISQDTEGLAVDVGVVGGNAIERVERLVAFMSDIGPYLASEGGVEAIGGKIENIFDALTRTLLPYSVVCFHKGRRELWFLLPGRSTTIYCYNLRLQSWTGPWTYPFTIYTLARYEDASGDEYVIAGCSDGFIRHMDIGVADDVDSGGSGGTAISWQADFSPVFFSPGPGVVKQLHRVSLQAKVPAGQMVVWRSKVDTRAVVEYNVTGASSDVMNYRIDLNEQGGRFRFGVRGTNTANVLIHGFAVEGWDYQRPR